MSIQRFSIYYLFAPSSLTQHLFLSQTPGNTPETVQLNWTVKQPLLHSIWIASLVFRCSYWLGLGLPWWLSGKDMPANAGDMGSIPESGRSPGEGNGNPLQYSCLGKPMDREAWWATVLGVAKESDMTEWLNNNKFSSIWKRSRWLHKLGVQMWATLSHFSTGIASNLHHSAFPWGHTPHLRWSEKVQDVWGREQWDPLSSQCCRMVAAVEGPEPPQSGFCCVPTEPLRFSEGGWTHSLSSNLSQGWPSHWSSLCCSLAEFCCQFSFTAPVWEPVGPRILRAAQAPRNPNKCLFSTQNTVTISVLLPSPLPGPSRYLPFT